jgi:hypothetical protein
MTKEMAIGDEPASPGDAGVKRRGLLRLGTLMTALTGASAMSVMGADSAQAALGDETDPIRYIPVAEKATPSGVATLDANAKILPAQLPDLSATYARRSLISTPKPFAAPTKTTSPATICVIGVDEATGVLYGRNASFGPFAQSDTGGVTWVNRSTPAGVTTSSVLKAAAFKGYVYVLYQDTASGIYGIYRTQQQPQGTPFGAWSTPVKTLIPGTSGNKAGFNAGSQYLFIGEYEADGVDIAAAGGPMLHRSADGVTWETVWGPDRTVKHVHGVKEDPYNTST